MCPLLCCLACVGLMLRKGERKHILAWIALVQCHTRRMLRQAVCGGAVPGQVMKEGSDSVIIAGAFELNKFIASVNALMWVINNEEDF